MLSGCCCFETFYFALGNNLKVGEFYENKSTGKILTFVKVSNGSWYKNYIPPFYGYSKCG
jgi:hypothetical protein